MKPIQKFVGYIKFKISLFFLLRFDDLIIFFQKLRPSTYISNLRIKEMNSKEIKAKDNVCIFIIFEQGLVPKLTWDAIKTIKAMGIKTFLVVNSILSEQEVSKIKKTADIFMFRNNTGKDIGAYKDAFIHLKNRGDLVKIERLIFANDSVVYPKKFIKKIFDKLIKNKANFIGYSHVQEIHYHIQSFLFSCDNILINDSTFIKFWEKYLPIDRRRYMINKGEVGITKTVIKTGRTISIINNIDNLINTNISLGKLLGLYQSLPTKHLTSINFSENMKYLIKVSNKNTRKLPNAFKGENVKFNRRKINQIEADLNNHKKIQLDLCIYNFVNEIQFRNAAHWQTFIYLALNMPIVIKRDLIYRAGYNYEIFRANLKKYLTEDIDEIMLMMKSPASNHFKGLKKIMFDNGII